jgi:hypothetical protein
MCGSYTSFGLLRVKILPSLIRFKVHITSSSSSSSSSSSGHEIKPINDVTA